MSKPVVVSFPHNLGKDEAVRRLKSGIGRVVQGLGDKVAMMDETWTGDHLDFHLKALGQAASGTVDVAEDHVRMEVQLPWVLALMAEKAKSMMEQRGKLLLEKK